MAHSQSQFVVSATLSDDVDVSLAEWQLAYIAW